MCGPHGAVESRAVRLSRKPAVQRSGQRQRAMPIDTKEVRVGAYLLDVPVDRPSPAAGERQIARKSSHDVDEVTLTCHRDGMALWIVIDAVFDAAPTRAAECECEI